MTNKDIIKDWFASIDANTLEKNASMLASNHEFHNPMTPMPLGAAEHIGMIQQMNAAFSSGSHTLHNIYQDGDHVIIHGNWSGKHTGDFMGIAPTGKDLGMSFIDIVKIENGKIAEEHMEFNPASFMTLGA